MEAGSGDCLSKKEIISNFLQGTVVSHNERFGDDETDVAESSANEIESVVPNIFKRYIHFRSKELDDVIGESKLRA
ncbi:hypothetical protein Tco_0821572 [Tanacetum coccineum]|uniref:Uncharacterized protein n=1 Tax=Tanacetum coccineum TaxID=301880 RepID=A0ABQ5AGR6_9ASTR